MLYPDVEAIPGETEESARKSCSYEDCRDFSHDDWLKRFRPTTQYRNQIYDARKITPKCESDARRKRKGDVTEVRKIINKNISKPVHARDLLILQPKNYALCGMIKRAVRSRARLLHRSMASKQLVK